jgi:hypothetical protein
MDEREISIRTIFTRIIAGASAAILLPAINRSEPRKLIQQSTSGE